eukprot:15438837-Alexandrium_andersonii.AAC.1
METMYPRTAPPRLRGDAFDRESNKLPLRSRNQPRRWEARCLRLCVDLGGQCWSPYERAGPKS